MRRKVVGAGPVATILDGNNAWSGPEDHVAEILGAMTGSMSATVLVAVASHVESH